MKPLSISQFAAGLNSLMPDPDVVRRLVEQASHADMVGLVRLWLTEGIPVAFSKCPMAYEALRAELGRRLNVDSKHISLVGSMRTGYSLAAEKYGRPVHDGSDLDLLVVDVDAFGRLESAFQRWQGEVSGGQVVPGNAREAAFWAEIAERVPWQLGRGFVDHKSLPNRYPEVRPFHDTAWRVPSMLRGVPGAPQPSKASFRVYRDWKSAVAQICRSLVRLRPSKPAQSNPSPRD